MDNSCYLFNKKVSKERMFEVKNTFKQKVGDWKPQFTNIKKLYLKFGNDWKLVPYNDVKELERKEIWDDMPKKAIEYLKSLPEFDEELFNKITGVK